MDEINEPQSIKIPLDPIKEALPNPKKNMKYVIAMLLIVLVLASAMLFIARKAYVYGGHIACKNSYSILNAEFKCELISQPSLTDINQYNLSFP